MTGPSRPRWTHVAIPVSDLDKAIDPDGNVIEFSYDQKVYSTIRELWGDAVASR
jgi:hypothetical protein